ncbi:MAG: hypothetical protein AAFW98_02300, partial [Pseudomonadota bacterium]
MSIEGVTRGTKPAIDYADDRRGVSPASPSANAGEPAAPDKDAARARRDRLLRFGLPLLVITVLLVGWEAIVIVNDIPQYILPKPDVVATTIVSDWPILGPALVNTLIITFAALALATVGGVLIAIALTQSRIIEYSFFPIAVVLQVTPIVAIFPLINIYVENIFAKLLLCAWIGKNATIHA